MRRCLLLLLLARPAAAVPGENWVSGEGQIQVMQLTEMVKQNAELVQLVATTVQILREANELAAYVREVKRQFDYIQSYDFDDLVRDVRRALYAAWPALGALERELKALAANLRALEAGDFWSHKDHHDRGALRRLERRVKLLWEGQIWGASGPLSKAPPAPTPIDAAMGRYYKATHQQEVRAKKLAALVIHAKKAEDLVQAARKSKHLEAEALAHTAQMLTQVVAALEEVRDLDRSERAREQQSRERAARAQRGFVSGMRKLMGSRRRR